MKNQLIGFATIAGLGIALASPATAQTTGSTEQDRERTTTERADEGARNVGERMSDAWIHTKVKTQFVGEDALEGSDIDVDVKNGIVTLKGTVASAAGRERAKELARTTEGVVRVEDKLTIGVARVDDDEDEAVGTAGRADRDDDNAREHGAASGSSVSGTREGERTTGREAYEESREIGREAREEAAEARDDAREEAREAKEEAREAREEARDEAREAEEEAREAREDDREEARDARDDADDRTRGVVGTAGAAVSDGWITTKVKTSFVGEDVLDNSDISVDTNDGVVTLKGTVASTAAKTRAEAITKDIDGVRRVKNELKVKTDGTDRQ